MACEKCQGIVNLPLQFFNPPLKYDREPCMDYGYLEESDWIPSPGPEPIIYQHWESLLLVQTSADRGCIGCSLILESLIRQSSMSSSYYWLETSIEQRQKEALEGLLSDTPAPIILKSVNTAFNSLVDYYNRKFVDDIPNQLIRHLEVSIPGTGRKGELEFYVRREDANDTPEWHAAIHGRELSGRSDSETCFNLAKEWLENCVQDHKDCSTSPDAEPPFLPTRVIDVGSNETSQEPRLVESSPGQRGQYVTLSHCWGKLPGPLTTQTDTLDERLAGIPIKTLPQTFQDAVVITRTFNIRYLWIDSLCIIQDSEEDWKKEACRMAAVYSHCHFSIAALLSSNSHDGIFNTRSTGRSLKLDVRDSQTDESGHIYLRRPAIPTITSSYEFLKGPLEERAWVLQERIMAPRILKYGADQMFWECQEGILLECRADPSPTYTMLRKTSDRANDMDIKGWKSQLRAAGRIEEPESSDAHILESSQKVDTDTAEPNQFDTKKNTAQRAIYDLWYNVINEYSRRKLTRETDKLPALSALAEEFARLTGDIYLSGFWKNDLLHALLWRTETSYSSDQIPEGRGTKPNARLAPSWSWVAVNGWLSTKGEESHERKRDKDLDARILDVEMLFPGPEQVFAFDNCNKLTISGLVYKPHYVMTQRDSIYSWEIAFGDAIGDGYWAKGHLDIEPWDVRKGHSSSIFDTQKSSGDCELLLLCVFDGGWSSRWRGLILSKPNYSGESKRIGVFSYRPIERDIHEVRQAWERREITLI